LPFSELPGVEKKPAWGLQKLFFWGILGGTQTFFSLSVFYTRGFWKKKDFGDFWQQQ